MSVWRTPIRPTGRPQSRGKIAGRPSQLRRKNLAASTARRLTGDNGSAVRIVAANIAFLLAIALMASCGPRKPRLENAANGRELLGYQLAGVRGIRDGDTLFARVIFERGPDARLTLDMRFSVGSPTRFESGRYQWLHDRAIVRGGVEARSVTFLGGQDGPPSLGGAFLIMGTRGVPQFKAILPVTVVTHDPSVTGPVK
jgi:hypothetical protein